MLSFLKFLPAVVSAAVKYGPVIAAFVQFLDEQRQQGRAREAATAFERGFRVFTETKDPKALEDAIRSHCGPNGCLLP